MKVQEYPTLKLLLDKAIASGIDTKDAFKGKDLSGEDLIEVEFHLDHFNLEGTIFNGANLSHCNLSGCNLRNAKFRGCDLTRAKIRGANLHQADLSEADLQYADLRGANLSETNVAEAKFNGTYGLSQSTIRKLKDRRALIPEESHSKSNNRWLLENLWLPIVIVIIGAIISAFAAFFLNSLDAKKPDSSQRNTSEMENTIEHTDKPRKIRNVK